MGSGCGKNSTQEVKQPLEIFEECYPTDCFDENEEDIQNAGLTCTICLGVMQQAVKDKCGHSFGYKCLKTWYKINKTCPLSRKVLDGHVRIDLVARQKIIKLKSSDKSILQNLQNEKDVLVVENQKYQEKKLKLKQAEVQMIKLINKQ